MDDEPCTFGGGASGSKRRWRKTPKAGEERSGPLSSCIQAVAVLELLKTSVLSIVSAYLTGVGWGRDSVNWSLASVPRQTSMDGRLGGMSLFAVLQMAVPVELLRTVCALLNLTQSGSELGHQ